MSKSLMCYVFCFLLVGFGFTNVVAAQTKREKSVNEKILKILIQKNIISRQKYEELVRELHKENAPKKPKTIAGFKKGFFIETPDGNYRIRLSGRFHGDYKSYLGNHPEHDSFFVRRARLCLSGTLHKYYDFRVESEFGKGGSRLNDGFMNIRYFPQAQIMFGQFKTPFSMEELTSDNWIDFVERSLANKLVPSRDLGVMLHGGIKDERLFYQLGIFNGYKLNQTKDPDSGKDVALRLVVAPFKKSRLKAMKGLRLGGSVTFGHEELTESQWWNSGNFKTAAGTTYLGMKNGVLQDGDRIREGLELYWDWGSTAWKGEYITTKLKGLKLGELDNDFVIKGGYLSISHCLTGEKFSYKNGKPGRIIPLKKFDPGSSGWGALQIGARLEFLKADKGFLDLGYADSSQYTNKASGLTLGLNWYPNDRVRFMLNYSHVIFGNKITVENKRIDEENLILTRFEVVF